MPAMPIVHPCPLSRVAALTTLLAAGCAASAPAPAPAQPAAPEPAFNPVVEPAVAPSTVEEAGRVVLSPALVVGGMQMSPAAIDAATAQFRSTVEANLAPLRRCYAQGLRRNAQLQGTVSADITLQTDGAVYNLKASDIDLPDPQVAECVLQALRTLPYRPIDGKLFAVTAPLVFKPQ